MALADMLDKHLAVPPSSDLPQVASSLLNVPRVQEGKCWFHSQETASRLGAVSRQKTYWRGSEEIGRAHV